MLVYIDGELTVRSPNAHNITAALPELPPTVDHLASRTVVLDGELVARQGRPWDFYGLGARLGAQSSVAAARGRARTPVPFAAFDVLVLEGERQTRVAHEAVTAHVLRGLDRVLAAREERDLGVLTAGGVAHPRRPQAHALEQLGGRRRRRSPRAQRARRRCCLGPDFDRHHE